ncbi:MAG: phytanoyl-CoA dioxygenase family protein [Hyphomonadaceae bacterium]
MSVQQRRDVAPPAGEEIALFTRLQADGYLILRRAMESKVVAELLDDLNPRFEATPFCQGDFYGARTKRFGALLKRSKLTQHFVMHEKILRIVELALGPYCDRVQLNLTQALQIYPGALRQAPHRDQDMYWAAPGAAEYLVNVMWPFGPYTAENGATLIYPGSNRRQDLGAADLAAPIAAELEAGDALLFLGSTLHGAGANQTDAPRTGMIVSYSLGWLKPTRTVRLAYPLSEVAARIPARTGGARWLLRAHRPNLGTEANAHRYCSRLLRLEFLAATDISASGAGIVRRWFAQNPHQRKCLSWRERRGDG